MEPEFKFSDRLEDRIAAEEKFPEMLKTHIEIESTSIELTTAVTSQVTTERLKVNQDMLCSEHNESYIAFCIDEDCKTAICISCMPSHIGHHLLNHESLAEYVKKSVISSTLPRVESGLTACDKRIEQVETLPKRIEAEITTLRELTESMYKTTLEQQGKFKESLEIIKAHCERNDSEAKAIKEKIQLQAKQYNEALEEMEVHNSKKSFNGVYKKWQDLKQLGAIANLSIDQSTEEQIDLLSKKMHKLTESITSVIALTIKKLVQLSSVDEIEVNTKVPQPIPLIKSSEIQSPKVPSESMSDRISCTACGLMKKMSAKLTCGCCVCHECIREIIIQKFTENFPESFKPPLIECKNCKKDCKVASLRLSICNCLCNAKNLRERPPFSFNSQRNAFEWPSCYNNAEHKLDMKDILLLWGSSGYLHFDKDLTVDQALKTQAIKHELSFSINTRPLTLEQIVGLAQILKGSKTIKHLICGPKTVQGFDKIPQLIEGITGNPNLETLIFKQNQWAKSIGALSEVLPTIPQLKTLDLAGNELGVDGLIILLQGIHGLKSCMIQILNLSNNDLGAQGMKILAESLPIISSLKKLYIDNNRIGMKGAKHLAIGLKDSAIQLLNLNGNGIGAQGVKNLCEVLEKNHSIRELYMQSNDIVTEGAKFVAELIEKAKIRVLSLPQNRIGLEGIRRLAEAIGNSTSLQILSLADNYIGIDGAKAVINAVEGSENMRMLDLSSNKLSDEDINEFKARMTQKKVLLKV